ncbi:ribonuclease P protein component [Flavobacterium sp. CYK-55]|uniref:ribonuclease P protein component n=1 Tax=Flavobacterium sp. CYK-55 TaxID=2835529 RepID=UPI001BCD2E79|nr:ribonuclease P protein component [Flavobacterium sp. CYK-55]MBS7786131.1 ribonuclease P protein component [Flavobacterium sp. CYK-55]
MKYTYPKSEKLKSQKVIESLFKEGKSVAKYPLRLVYVGLNPTEENQHFVGVSVSKKYFKKAVDRNYYKRLLRESYRLNQQLLKEKLQTPMAIMLFYQTNQPMSLEEMQHKMRLLFEKFHTNNNEQ